MNEKRTIRITGKGNIKVKPDLTRITITLSGIYPEYDETLRKSSESTEQMKELLTAFDLERSDLKTLNFNVDTKYETYEKNNTYKRHFVGYEFRHVLKVEFESDNVRLGKILYALAHCAQHPEFKISYTTKDVEAAKNVLLGEAVRDAKKKAVILTQAAEVVLGDICSIDYSWGKLNFEVHPATLGLMSDECCEAPRSSYDLDIEPDDIDVSDTVTVVWEIV